MTCSHYIHIYLINYVNAEKIYKFINDIFFNYLQQKIIKKLIAFFFIKDPDKYFALLPST